MAQVARGLTSADVACHAAAVLQICIHVSEGIMSNRFSSREVRIRVPFVS